MLPRSSVKTGIEETWDTKRADVFLLPTEEISEECRLLAYDAVWFLQELTFRKKASPQTIRVTRIAEPGIMLALASNRITLRRNPVSETMCFPAILEFRPRDKVQRPSDSE
jgi:hypothetical protein